MLILGVNLSTFDVIFVKSCFMLISKVLEHSGRSNTKYKTVT
jgi:hypothetical protein